MVSVGLVKVVDVIVPTVEVIAVLGMDVAVALVEVSPVGIIIDV